MNTAASKKRTTSSTKSKTGRQPTRHSVRHDVAAQQKEAQIRKKIKRLNDALDGDPVDFELLRKMMITADGSVTDDLRCKVWPKLLNVDVFNKPKKKKADEELKEFQSNIWWHQVNLDVNRAHRRFPVGSRMSRKRVLQQQLTNIIMRVLCRHPELHYYQGYHDIAVTLLRVVGEELAFSLLEQLSTNHIRDFMDKNMNRTNRMLSLFYAVLSKVDKQLEQFLLRSDVGTIFALSWLITWFGHDVNSFETIVRLCDFFLATHPVMPVYVSVVLVRNHKTQVLQQECDMAMVHHCLCRLPAYLNIDDIDDVIKQAHDLYQQHPPTSLRSEVRIYLKESDSISHHAELLYRSYNQKPDRILRKRKKYGLLFTDTSLTSSTEVRDTDGKQLALIGSNQTTNPLVKVAVWTMTVSMGVMTFLVLNTSKYWM